MPNDDVSLRDGGVQRLLLIALVAAGVTSCRSASDSAPEAPNTAVARGASTPKARPPSNAGSAPATQEGNSCLGLPEADGTCSPGANASVDRGDTNIDGEALAVCSTDPMTGWFRNGKCATGPNDRGVHVVCAEMTSEFLAYTKGRGNDLSTPAPKYGFPGLQPGDRWCLCAARWEEARRAGKAPPVVVEATHGRALDIVKGEHLKEAAMRTAASTGRASGSMR